MVKIFFYSIFTDIGQAPSGSEARGQAPTALTRKRGSVFCFALRWIQSQLSHHNAVSRPQSSDHIPFP